MKKIKVRRISRLANKFGSFAYAIVDAKGLDLDLFDGIYTNQAGEPFLYSPNNIGDYQVDNMVSITERTVRGKKFINLEADIPVWVDEVQRNTGLADRLGFGDQFKTQVAQNLAKSINFGGLQTVQTTQAPAVVNNPSDTQPSTEEEPAEITDPVDPAQVDLDGSSKKN